MSETTRVPTPPRSADALVTELRELWESGRRAPALRAALAGWEILPQANGGLSWLETALRRAGLTAEAFAVRGWTVRGDGDARAWVPFVRSVLQTGDPWWAAELLRQAPRGSRELDALAIEVQLAIGDAAEAIAAWQRAYRDDAAQAAAVEWWVRCNRIAAAEELAAATPSLALWRARFAIWRNRPDLARAQLAALPPSPARRCLEAVATLQEGRVEDAEAQLRALLDGEAQADAWSWLATVLRKQRRYDEALQAAEQAAARSQRFNLVLWIERRLATERGFEAMAPAAPEHPIARWLWRRGLVRGRVQNNSYPIGDLEHAWALYPLGVTADTPVTRLAELVERFGGNHSADPTITDGETLTAYPVPPDAGQVGVSVQAVLATRGAEAARAVYRELLPRVPGPRFQLYQGETELWLGAYATAAEIFRDVLAQQSTMKWAWIGLGAAAMLTGDFAAAQRTWDEGLAAAGTAGPTLSVYRGECYRRQGEQAAARQQLELAVQQKPQRLSAWINLALLERDPELLRRVDDECRALMPILMDELAGDTPHRLEAVLEAMRGNRSSTRITYHLWDRLWHAPTRHFPNAPA